MSDELIARLKQHICKLEADYAQQGGVLEAVIDVLDGEAASDFMGSFSLVRRVMDLKAELAEERKYSATKEDVKTLEELLEARDAEIARLREALVWYAARRTGEPAWSKERGRSVIDVDGGNLARKALEDTSHE